MWLPEVAVRESYTRGNNPVFVFGSLLEQGKFGAANFDPAFLNDPPSLTNWRRALSVRYPLFDQLRRWTTIDETRYATTQAKQSSDIVRQEIRLAVLRSYFGLQLARERASVATAAVKSAESGAAALQSRFDAGLVPRSELLAAQVQLSEFRQQNIEAAGEVAVAEAALNQRLRRPLSESPVLETPLSEKSFAAGSLDDALVRGRAARPELKNARLSVDIARLEVRAAHGSLLPRVDAFAEFGASGATFRQHDSDHTAGVTLSWNVLDPSRAGRVAESHAAARAARDAEIAAADDVDLEIITAFHRYQAAREKVEVGRQTIEQAESATKIVDDRYEQGLTTITEQLRAQTALLRARMSFLAARYETYLAYAELLRSTGGLDDVQPFL